MILRKAKPEFNQGLIFARYLDQAAEGFFSFLLGKRSGEILARAFMQPGHDLSYQHVTFAEQENTIVAMVSGYTSEQHRQSSDLPLMQAAGKWNFRWRVLRILFSPIFRIIDNIPEQDFYLQAMAVEKELRGRGLGSILMDHVEGLAREAGSKRLALDVAAANKGAFRLYKGRGMTVESQWPKRLNLPQMKFLRMVKEL